MTLWIRRFLVLIASTCLLGAAEAQIAVGAAPEGISVCPATGELESPPDFSSPDCQRVSMDRIDPHKRLIWVRADLNVPDSILAGQGPLGLYLYAKASSTIYLNGVRIGQNGAPAATRDAEIPGLMDFVASAPRDVLKPGENEIVLLMSSHHGYLDLISPVHVIGVAPYANPTQSRLGYYWPSLIPFGVLLAGALYFAIASIRSADRKTPLILVGLISLFAAGQLLAEVSRGLTAYTYPVQDLRLIVIVATSLGVGLSLAALVVWTFGTRGRALVLAAIAAAAILAIAFNQSFDHKAAFAMFVPICASAVYAAWAAFRRKPHALSYALALSVSAALVFFSPLSFLDVYFFYAVAALVMFLFAQQAIAAAREVRLRASAQEHSRKLELVLEQLREHKSPDHIAVSGAGSIDRISIDRITYCSGAGDYVEIHTADGGNVLHGGSLNGLESRLPATFIRVHRSHIVNTAFVRRLERDASGVGRLVLTTEAEIPVSRRILPRVRDALG